MKAISLLALIAACSSGPTKKFHPVQTPLDLKRDEYRQCFLESGSYKGRNTDERRTVKVFFIIDIKGRVTRARIAESPFNDPNFHACLLDVVRGIKFPPPRDGNLIEVLEPLNFYPVEY